MCPRSFLIICSLPFSPALPIISSLTSISFLLPFHSYFGPLFCCLALMFALRILSPSPFLSVFSSSFSSLKDVTVFRVTVTPLSSSADLSPLYDWGQCLSPWCLTSPWEAIHVHGYRVQFKHGRTHYFLCQRPAALTFYIRSIHCTLRLQAKTDNNHSIWQISPIV